MLRLCFQHGGCDNLKMKPDVAGMKQKRNNPLAGNKFLRERYFYVAIMLHLQYSIISIFFDIFKHAV